MIAVHTRSGLVVVCLAAMLVAAACSQPTLPAGERQPKPCAAVYPVARCDAMTDIVAADIGKDRDDVASVAIVPDAPPGGVHLSAGWHIKVRLALKDGTTYTKEVCGGVLREPACAAETRLEVRLVIDDEAVDTAPKTVATAIDVPTLSIAIDHRGQYEIPLGKGPPPNGTWTSGTLQFAVPWPDDLALRDATVTLDVRNGERHPRPSVVFDVLWFRPGATLEIRNVRVD
jgi:hypothetical protein